MILVTGATGYLGSHMVVELLNRGYKVYGIDNFSNSSHSIISRIKRIATHPENFLFRELDLADKSSVGLWLMHNSYNISTIVHFAGFKSVPDSVAEPILYYRNNLDCTMNVCTIAQCLGIKNIIFSSSSTVYSDVNQVPFNEETATIGGSSPYGWTKIMSEQILRDYCNSTGNNCLHLRYFNPVGSHESGLLGDTNDNGLMVNILRAANGESILSVFGDDYDTKDGTCIRDYIHVDDLIEAHIASINFMDKNRDCGVQIFNIGTGNGYTVLDMINAFFNSVGKEVPYNLDPRREGDPPILIANNRKAVDILGWSPKKTLEEMCISAQHYYEKGVKYDSNDSST